MEPNLFNFLAKKYKLVLIDDSQKLSPGDFHLGLLDKGIVCNFLPSKTQTGLLAAFFDKVNLHNTLFTFDQALNLDLQTKLQAQIGEYILSYGLGGAFVRTRKKQSVETCVLTGVNAAELGEVLGEEIARPVALKSSDIKPLAKLVAQYVSPINIDAIKNNELRVSLLGELLDRGASPENLTGDDLMRFVVMRYTDSTLLIKSRAVISTIRESVEERVPPQFYFDHADLFARCFNRFKPIFMALRKSKPSKKAINKISHLSKKLHVPMVMPRSRTFIADYLRGYYKARSPQNFSVYDWLRILNALKVRMSQTEHEIFLIRNGKVWYQKRRHHTDIEELCTVQQYVLDQLAVELSHLKQENVKLPQHIRLGLPISQKQSMGALPFGSVISTQSFSDAISVGIYWENEWGASDLDLSIIDISGQRTGWGDAASYNQADVKFSGDITNAPEGAMEYMTVKRPTNFGLFVNIYNGQVGCGCKLVIGREDRNKDKWLDEIYISEKLNLGSFGNLIGFLNSAYEYVVYQGQISGATVSSPKNKAIVERALVPLWTLNSLFEALDISFDPSKPISLDLSYDSLSFNKLANMMLKD